MVTIFGSIGQSRRTGRYLRKRCREQSPRFSLFNTGCIIYHGYGTVRYGTVRYLYCKSYLTKAWCTRIFSPSEFTTPKVSWILSWTGMFKTWELVMLVKKQTAKFNQSLIPSSFHQCCESGGSVINLPLGIGSINSDLRNRIRIKILTIPFTLSKILEKF